MSAPANIVCCHGAGGNARSFESLASSLRARGHRVLPLSYPGRLDVEGPPHETVGELASFVERRVRAVLGESTRHVVLGHSMGGAVAIEYALRRPPGLDAMILLSTGARLRVMPAILAAMRAACMAEAEGRPRIFSPMGFRPDASDEVLAHAAEVDALTPAASRLADWIVADGFDRMSEVSEISVPSLVLVGAEDALTPPKYARYLAERIPDAELHEVADAGHMMLYEQPEEVAERIADFWAGLPADTNEADDESAPNDSNSV